MKKVPEIVLSVGSKFITRWNISTGKIDGLEKSGHSDRMTCSLSVSEHSYCCGSLDGTVSLWNYGKKVHSFDGHKSGAISIDSSNTKFGHLLFVGCGNGSIRIWDVMKNRSKKPNAEYSTKNPVYSITSLGGLKFASSTEGGVRIWDLQSNKEHAMIGGMDGWIKSSTFLEKHRVFISGKSGGFYLTHLDETLSSPGNSMFIPQPNREVSSLDSHLDSYIIAGNSEGEVLFYDLRKLPNPLKSYKVHDKTVSKVLSFPNLNPFFVTCSLEKSIIWSFKNSEISIARKFEGSQSTTTEIDQISVCFQASGDKDNTLRTESNLSERLKNFEIEFSNFFSCESFDSSTKFKTYISLKESVKKLVECLQYIRVNFKETIPELIRSTQNNSIRKINEFKLWVREVPTNDKNKLRLYVGENGTLNEKYTGSGELFIFEPEKGKLAKVYDGNMENGIMQGRGKVFSENVPGKLIFDGYFEKGKMVKKYIPQQTTKNEQPKPKIETEKKTKERSEVKKQDIKEEIMRIMNTSEEKKKLDEKKKESNMKKSKSSNDGKVRRRSTRIEKKKKAIQNWKLIRRKIVGIDQLREEVLNLYDDDDDDENNIEKEEEEKKKKIIGSEVKKLIRIRDTYMKAQEEFLNFKKMEEMIKMLEKEVETYSELLDDSEDTIREYENRVEKIEKMEEKEEEEGGSSSSEKVRIVYDCPLNPLTGLKEGEMGKKFREKNGVLQLEYIGSFKNGKKWGEGTEYYHINEAGGGKKKYTGMFKEDKWDGIGTLYFTDGETKCYEGNYKGGVQHGRGAEFSPLDGEKVIFRGRWRDGKPFVADVDLEDVPLFEFEEVQDSVDAKNSLGKGSFGSVYKISFRGQPAALKIFNFSGRNYEERENLVNKTESTLRMTMGFKDHPNIIKILGWCKKGHISYVMELCKKSIQDVIDKEVVSLSEKIRILYRTCNGVEALHFAGIIHRDLKWENVLIDQGNQVKIIDFDLAVLQHGYRKDWILKEEAGTPFFIDPRVLQKQEYDESCDVYSFGIMMYMLIFLKGMPYEYNMETDKYIISCSACGEKESLPGHVKKHIIECNLRPIIPEKYDPKLQYLVNIMKMCWDIDHTTRPSFKRLSMMIRMNK